MNRNLASFHAAVFDLDGTLLDTESLSTQAMQAVLDRLGTGKTIEWDLKRRLLGLPGSLWGPIVVSELNLEIEPAQLVAEWETNLSALSSRVEEMPGSVRAVDTCIAAGLKCGIATSSNKLAVEKKATRHRDSIFNKMQTIVCGDDNELQKGRGKPHPDIFLLAAARLLGRSLSLIHI